MDLSIGTVLLDTNLDAILVKHRKYKGLYVEDPYTSPEMSFVGRSFDPERDNMDKESVIYLELAPEWIAEIYVGDERL